MLFIRKIKNFNIIAEKGTLKIAGQYFDEITYQNIEDIEQDYILKKYQ